MFRMLMGCDLQGCCYALLIDKVFRVFLMHCYVVVVWFLQCYLLNQVKRFSVIFWSVYMTQVPPSMCVCWIFFLLFYHSASQYGASDHLVK